MQRNAIWHSWLDYHAERRFGEFCSSNPEGYIPSLPFLFLSIVFFLGLGLGLVVLVLVLGLGLGFKPSLADRS